jgi:hypothetical protein
MLELRPIESQLAWEAETRGSGAQFPRLDPEMSRTEDAPFVDLLPLNLESISFGDRFPPSIPLKIRLCLRVECIRSGVRLLLIRNRADRPESVTFGQ